MTSFLKDGRSRIVAIWLLVVAFMIFAMLVVGGATRLTGSGLSITEWKPVSGALPPLSDADWRKDFALYQATPQYREVNRGMTLAEFRTIFWWEWTHRLLGRLVGLVVAAPLLVLLAMRAIPARLIWRCALILVLGAVQGAVGWWMVESGLEARVSVAPERLAIHLGLALFLFCVTLWTALEAWSARTCRSTPWPCAQPLATSAERSYAPHIRSAVRSTCKRPASIPNRSIARAATVPRSVSAYTAKLSSARPSRSSLSNTAGIPNNSCNAAPDAHPAMSYNGEGEHNRLQISAAAASPTDSC